MHTQICVYVFLFLVTIVFNAHAQSQAGGVIAADVTWLLAQSPYTVTADIVIQNDATLTIEPGVTIYMAAGTNLIVNSGALRTVGTISAPVVITSANDIANGIPVAGSWGEILFQDGTKDADTVLEWTQIRYGSGLRIESASPTFNSISIQNHLAPAISMDLKSSPKGSGLKAIGNTLNGIRVPAGEVADSVRWQLQGIPYVIPQGEVSIGKKPNITAINPISVQKGLTTDAVISGTRLAGAESIYFDAAGVTATLSSGASETGIPLKITVSDTQPLSNIPFEIQTAAGRVRYESGISITATKPLIEISSIAPGALRRGESKTFQIVGNRLQGAQIAPPAGAGLTIGSLTTTENQAAFTIAASASAVLGSQTLTITNPSVANSATAMVAVNPTLPIVYANPAVLVTPPDSTSHSFFLQLSHSDNVAHTLNLSMSDPTIATISPAIIAVSAGNIQVPITVTGLKLGTTQLNVTSSTLAAVNIQTYVTNALNGSSVGPVLSPIVGVSRVFDSTTFPAGQVLGPIVSKSIGVDRIFDSTTLPVGQVLGPIVSKPIGVDRVFDTTALPEGGVLGPIVSPIVEVER